MLVVQQKKEKVSDDNIIEKMMSHSEFSDNEDIYHLSFPKIYDNQQRIIDPKEIVQAGGDVENLYHRQDVDDGVDDGDHSDNDKSKQRTDSTISNSDEGQNSEDDTPSNNDSMMAKQRCTQCKCFICTIIVICTLFFAGFIVTSTVVFGEPFFLLERSQTFRGQPPNGITVGAYYYPWHADDFHRDQGYLRESINHRPLLGEYDDRNPNVVAQHLEWSRRANINLWAISWWGPKSRTDLTTLNSILPHEGIGDLQIALHYETQGRIRKEENYTTQRVYSDVEYMCQEYFHSPNYYKIDDRPVIIIYMTRVLETQQVLEEAISEMRLAALENCNQEIYIIGDHLFRDPPKRINKIREPYKPFQLLDAVTNFDIYGSMRTEKLYAGRSAIRQYYDRQDKWRSYAWEQGCRYVPSVSPGYNDRAVRFEENHQPLSRKLSPTSLFGSFFSYSIKKARYLVDETVQNLILVNSFNEWHEDTQIEPTIGDLTSVPFNMTGGIEYDGFSHLYLDLLREGTVDIRKVSSSNNEKETFQDTIYAPTMAPTSEFPYFPKKEKAETTFTFSRETSP